jgi:hypothetical protein
LEPTLASLGYLLKDIIAEGDRRAEWGIGVIGVALPDFA